MQQIFVLELPLSTIDKKGIQVCNGQHKSLTLLIEKQNYDEYLKYCQGKDTQNCRQQRSYCGSSSSQSWTI